MTLTKKQQTLCDSHDFDFSGLSALFLNCTLKPTGTLSHTEHLLNVPYEIMKANGIHVDMVRPVDFNIPPGVYPDMREHGFSSDEWPKLCEKVLAADILILATPIGWVRKAPFAGELSSASMENLEN